MAKDKDKKEYDKKKQLKLYSDYPIKTLFQISILGGAIAFILTYIGNTNAIWNAIFRGFIIFIALAVFGSIMMITVVSILAKIHEQQAEEMRHKIEDEQREFFEHQLRLQDEMDKLAQNVMPKNE